jgi:integrase
MTRRHFGSVRKRPSGRWQALYWQHERVHSAGTFATKADAQAFLSAMETDLRRGKWIDPRGGQVTLSDYANEWLKQRTDLAERTSELYRHVLDKHVLPVLGTSSLAGLNPTTIRSWHTNIAKDHPATASKAYRLLASVMRTAVADGILLTSPCKVEGAGTEHAAERPTASVQEVESLSRAMPEHLRIVVPLAVWCQMRRGEMLGLRRMDIDLKQAVIHVLQSRTFGMDGKPIVKLPKTSAGRRSIAVPRPVLKALIHHLELFTAPEPEALVLIGRAGVSLSRDALQGSWERARLTIRRPDLRLHDMRHTGLTLAAATGATTAELMHRAGHASAPAALRYQHATRDRDRRLSNALEVMIPEPDDLV